MLRSIILLVCLGFGPALAGCASGDATAPDGQPQGAPSEGHMAVVHYGGMDLGVPGIEADYARADIVVLEMSFLWNDRYAAGVVARMKAANPNVRVIGYINAHTSWLSWGDDPDSDPSSNPYGWDWYQRTKPYWSATTAADTMMPWPGKVVLDVLDPDCRQAIIGVLADHWHAHDNLVDGIFWDHFNRLLWTADLANVEGEMDLDRDGVPHREDEDEMQAYRDASDALVTGVRRALGPRVIQVANGSRAAHDSVFAGLLDGFMYEHFPEVAYGGPGMERALDLQWSDNLFTARTWPRTENGGPWVILSNKHYISVDDGEGGITVLRQADINRAAALLSGVHVAYHSADQMTRYGWPEVEIDLGRRVSPAVVAGTRYSRRYERGRILVDFGASVGDMPFSYRIVQDDTVIQEFVVDSEVFSDDVIGGQ